MKNTKDTMPPKQTKTKTGSGATQPKGLPEPKSPSVTLFYVGCALIVFAALLTTSLLAFIFTGGADTNIATQPLTDLLTTSDIDVKNPLGTIGAWISDLLFTQCVGLASLSLPILIGAAGLKLLGVKKFSLLRFFIHTILVTIWCSIFFAQISIGMVDRLYAPLGGQHGYHVVRWLNSSIGLIGTVALLLFTMFLFVSLKAKKLQTHVTEILSRLHMPTINVIDNSPKPEEVQPLDNGNEGKQDEQTEPEPDPEPTFGPEVEPVVAPVAGPRPVVKPIVANPGNDFLVEVAKGDEEGENPMQPGGTGTDGAPADGGSIDLGITNPTKEEEAKHIGLDEKYDPTLDLAHYQMPSVDLLEDYGQANIELDSEELKANKDIIIETLRNFNIEINSIKATVGPTVTLYEIVPAPGIRISKIKGLENDIAMSLAAMGIRIIAPIPGKSAIGIEVPNSKPQIVSMKSVLKSKKFQESKAELPVAIGKTISNETYVFDLAETPHLLVAGATGQGKSVGLNAIITSILYKKHPSQVKFVLVDPKVVELSIYKVLEKHYLAKMASEEQAVISDIDKVRNTLQSLTVEMDDRYKLLGDAKLRGIKEYNAEFINRKLNPEKGHRFLPYIIVIIDEFADLIMQAGKEVETPIARIAQKARAVGIHMILATQRPSTNIITGVIKANFPSRIAFKVSSMVDSRTIIDTPGAQHLIGRGDMLVMMPKAVSQVRVQCAFVDTPEVTKITEHIASQQGYMSAYQLPDCEVESGSASGEGDAEAPGKFDPLIRDIAQVVVDKQIGSTSFIQRQFGVGYNRAGRISDQLERMGIVSPPDYRKERKVYVSSQHDLEHILEGFNL